MPPTLSIVPNLFECRRQFFDCCTAFRLSHHELHPCLTIDYFDGYLLFTHYLNFPFERASSILQELIPILEQEGLAVHGAALKLRPENLSHLSDDSRGAEPILLFGTLPPDRFVIQEWDLKFWVSFHTGHSIGLFLDIKHARQLVRKITKPGDQVLNLFSYTGGFSLAAAKAGAARVIEVDSSAKWLQWAKANQQLNDVTVVRQRREDAMRFLRKQKEASFDLIICDPPTYSTQKSGDRFTVEKSFAAMLDDLHRALRPDGLLLASTNYRGLSRAKFLAIFSRPFELVQEVPISEDFNRDDYLKVALLRKH